MTFMKNIFLFKYKQKYLVIETNATFYRNVINNFLARFFPFLFLILFSIVGFVNELLVNLTKFENILEKLSEILSIIHFKFTN